MPLLQMWCNPEEDENGDWGAESHCWESRDGGQTWRDAGIITGEPGPPEGIDAQAGCPRCGAPLKVK